MFSIKVKRWWNPGPVVAGLESGGREGARRASDFVAGRARIYVPKVSMRLHDSIEVRPSMAGARWNVVATAPYARRIEYGWTQGNTFIAPQPFMRRALADGRREFPTLLREAMVTARKGQFLGTSFTA